MQVLGNILLLLPVPIFMKLQNTKNTYSNKKLFLVGLALSFAIEVNSILYKYFNWSHRKN